MFVFAVELVFSANDEDEEDDWSGAGVAGEEDDEDNEGIEEAAAPPSLPRTPPPRPSDFDRTSDFDRASAATSSLLDSAAAFFIKPLDEIFSSLETDQADRSVVCVSPAAIKARLLSR